MRFFASWWERVPVRSAAPALVAMLVGFGLFEYVERLLADILGNYWT